MNLRGIANRYTSAVNPNLTVQLYAYAGFTVAGSGKPTATYADPVPVVAQVQSLSKSEIRHLDSLNISNVERAAYVNQQLQATDRTTQTGGDVLAFEDGAWRVDAILEGWTTAGWCKVGLVKQMPRAGQFGVPV